jgi:predicted MFS family arabinose efflux permease
MGGPRHSAWSPLRHLDFTLLWSAAVVSNSGSWMHDLAAGWLMTTLDPSPAMVALVPAATTLPVCLLALPAGTLADATDKRRLLIGVQVAMLLLAALLGVSVLWGWVGKATLLVVTFALGACTAIMSPTWQAIIPQLVPREELHQAVALHAVGINISRAIGPAIGGLVIVGLGIAWPFLINSLSFLAVIGALWSWRAPVQPPSSRPKETFLAALRTGLSHVPENIGLRNTLWRSVLFFSFSSAYWALLPLIARAQLQGGANLFGIIVACIGAGAVAGAVLLPKFRRRWGLDRMVTVGTLGTAAAMAAFATFHVPAFGLLAAALAGASWIAALSSLNVAAQLALPDWVRARGMGLYTSVFYGCLALGSICWGQIATRLGVAPTLFVAAAGAVVALVPAQRLPLAHQGART